MIEFPKNYVIYISPKKTYFFDEYVKEIKKKKIDDEKIWPYRLATNLEKNRLYVSDRLSYKIVVFNKNFEILNSWIDLSKTSLVDGLCFENNRLYLTDSDNNQIIVFQDYDNVNKFTNFDGHQQILKIDGYSPLDIKVHSINAEETMVCVICFDSNKSRNKEFPILYLSYDYYLQIYKLQKESFARITFQKIKNLGFRDWSFRHYFFYHSYFYYISFESKKIILYKDYGNEKKEIIGLEDIMKEDLNLNGFGNVTTYQDGLLLFYRSKSNNIDRFYQNIFLKISSVYHHSETNKLEEVEKLIPY